MLVAPRNTHLRRLEGAIVRNLRSVRPGTLDPGVTILIPYYRTPDLVETCLRNIRRHSSSLLRRVIVVDNGSGDGAGETLRDNVVDWIELPVNCGHGWALDYASWCVRTEYLLALDSDAWPVADTWLETLVKALDDGAGVAGIYAYREYIHPSCLAIKTETLRRCRLSFQPNLPRSPQREGWGRRWWDVGERISMTLRARGERLHKLAVDPPESADKVVGLTYGGIVFHLWYGTRVTADPDRATYHGVSRDEILAERAAATAQDE